jgi:phosphoglycerate kinase
MVGVPKLLPSYAGLLVEEEVKELTKALTPSRPSLAIIGGAKFHTKEPVVKKLLQIYDRVFVGGALANDFVKAEGYEIGASLTSDSDPSHLKELLKNPHLLLPLDYVVAPPGSKREAGHAALPNGVQKSDSILDNGPQTIAMLSEAIMSTKTILWNGPLGNFENGFTEATEAVARAVAASKAYSVVGGGDTVASIEKLNLNDRFSFISTGGGAMLEYLVDGTLPGIAVLN